MKNVHLKYKAVLFVLLHAIPLTTLKAQLQPRIPTAIGVPREKFAILEEIGFSIKYECLQNIECPQLNTANAKELGKAMEEIVVTLEMYKYWTEKGWMDSDLDSGWLEAKTHVNEAHDSLLKVLGVFYNAVSKFKIWPESVNREPGPSDNRKPRSAILDLNDRLKPQIDKLKMLDSKFTIKPAPNPAIQLNGRNFKPDEEIEISFTGRQCYPESAWVGIIPSSVPHKNARLAEQNKIFRKYISNNPNGKFKVNAPSSLGSYDVRMFDSNEDGNEVVSFTFNVVPEHAIANKKELSTGLKENTEVVYKKLPATASKNTGYLIIKTPVAGCNSKEELADITVEQKGVMKVTSWGAKKGKTNEFEIKPPPYRWEVKPGEYLVTMKTRIGLVTKKVKVLPNTETIFSRGNIAGYLDIYFIDNSGKPMPVDNYGIRVLNNDYPEYKNGWWKPAVHDSILLPVGKHSIKILYQVPKTSKLQEYSAEVNIKACERVTIKCYDGGIKKM